MAKKELKKDKEKKDKLKDSISPINRFNILFVDLQILFTVITIICLIWYFFNSKVWYILQIVLGITLIIIGYNNKIIYNRGKFRYVYYVIGVALIVFDILLMLGF